MTNCCFAFPSFRTGHCAILYRVRVVRTSPGRPGKSGNGYGCVSFRRAGSDSSGARRGLCFRRSLLNPSDFGCRVFVDVNANGQFDDTDRPMPGSFVFEQRQSVITIRRDSTTFLRGRWPQVIRNHRLPVAQIQTNPGIGLSVSSNCPFAFSRRKRGQPKSDGLRRLRGNKDHGARRSCLNCSPKGNTPVALPDFPGRPGERSHHAHTIQDARSGACGSSGMRNNNSSFCT